MLAQSRGFAFELGWEEIDHQEKIKMVSFRKKGTRINIYYGTGTVGTCLAHPKKGKTQLFRRHCSLYEIVEIFKNPRIHTKKGYRQKWVT